MTDTDRLEELTRLLGEAERALEPFASAFEQKRESYSRRYQDQQLGYTNFDKMPDSWPVEKLTFSMGRYRTARNTLNKIRSRENNG